LTLRLTFLGHACVAARAANGTTVVMDPYLPGAFEGALSFAPVDVRADVVTVSHYHLDHSHVSPDLGAPVVLDQAGEAAGLTFRARPTYHDREGGARMGLTTIFTFEMDGVRVCHLGDMGCLPTAADAEAVGPVDVLILPVGGTYTLGPDDAPAVLRAFQPRLALPVHYEGPKCHLGLASLDEALAPLEAAGYPVQRTSASTWTHAGGLPERTTVLALQPAR